MNEKRPKTIYKPAPKVMEPPPDNLMGKAIYWYKARKERIERKKQEPQTFGSILLSWTKTIIGAIIVVMIINGLAIASFVVPTGSMENTVMTGDFLFVNKFIYGPSTPQVIPFVNIPLPFLRFPGLRDPQKGDVIVFIYPGDRDEVEAKEFQYYLKRCIATAGDKLEIRDKVVFVNDKIVPLAPNGKYDPYTPAGNYDKWSTFPAGRGYTRDNYGPLRIPKKGDVIELNSSNWREWEYVIKREGHDIAFNGMNVLVDNKLANNYTIERDYCFGMGDNRDHSLDSRYWGLIPYENVVGTPIMVYWSWDTGLPISNLIDKLSTIRWSRIGTLIH